MNIFILSPDIELNAQYHCDKHSFATWTSRDVPDWYNAIIQGCNVPPVYHSLKAELDLINFSKPIKVKA